jgi:hypothetical protein
MTKLTRRTVILVSGMDVYVVSCDSAIEVDASSIVKGLRFGNVKVMGKGIVVFDAKQKRHFKELKDMKGQSMIFPNRSSVVELRDVSDKRHFASLMDIAPTFLKDQTSEHIGDIWHEIKTSVLCANCGREIPGRKRVKGTQAQIFRPDNKAVKNVAKRWYCSGNKDSCTKFVEVPKVEIGKKDNKKSLWPGSQGPVYSSIGHMTITFNGSPAEVTTAIKEYVALLK